MTKSKGRPSIPFYGSFSNRAFNAARNVYRAYTRPTRSDAIRHAGLTAGAAAALITRRRVRRRTKTLIAQGKVMNEGTGGQYSYYNGPKGKSYLPDHVENALAPQVIQSNTALQLKSAVAAQGVSNIGGVFLPSLATTFTSDKITRVIYDKCTLDVTMSNIYLSNCYLIIYDIMARKDIGTTTFTNPLGAWNQGDTDLGTSSAYLILGSTPWQSEAFNQYFEVKQVTNVVLAAGATHVHKVRLHPKRIVSSAYAQYTPTALKDLTYYTMIEVHGSPANDTTLQSQVSVGAGGLNIVIDLEQTIKQLQKATPTLTVTNGLNGFTNGEQVVNMGGSTIVPQAEG